MRPSSRVVWTRTCGQPFPRGSIQPTLPSSRRWTTLTPPCFSLRNTSRGVPDSSICITASPTELVAGGEPDADASVALADAGVVSAEEAVRMATLEGARTYGLGEVTGSLVPGKWADLCCVDLRAAREAFDKPL